MSDSISGIFLYRSNFMSNYLRTSFIAIALLVVFGVSQANAQVQEVLKRMDEHQKALVSLKANIVMDKFNSQLDEHDISEGTAMYLKVKERDAMVRLEWTKPQQEILTVANNKYILYQIRLGQAYQGNVDDAQKKQTGGAGSFDFLKMSKEQLKANYSYVYYGREDIKSGGVTVETWHLELTPKTPKSYKSVDIWVDGNGMVLQTKVNEKNGDSSTVLLSNLKKNETIKPADFVLKLPKTTKIIKA